MSEEMKNYLEEAGKKSGTMYRVIGIILLVATLAMCAPLYFLFGPGLPVVLMIFMGGPALLIFWIGGRAKKNASKNAEKGEKLMAAMGKTMNGQ